MFLPIVTLVVWARLVFLDREQEEMAADLGAPPGDVLGRVILPQIRLAVLAGAAVVFAGSLGEFVIVDKLVGPNDTRAVGPVLLATVTNASPRVNAVGTTLAITAGIAFALLASTFAAVFKRSRTGERGEIDLSGLLRRQSPSTYGVVTAHPLDPRHVPHVVHARPPVVSRDAPAVVGGRSGDLTSTLRTCPADAAGKPVNPEFARRHPVTTPPPDLWAGDEADAELVHLTGRQKMQAVDHRVVTAHE